MNMHVDMCRESTVFNDGCAINLIFYCCFCCRSLYYTVSHGKMGTRCWIRGVTSRPTGCVKRQIKSYSVSLSLSLSKSSEKSCNAMTTTKPPNHWRAKSDQRNLVRFFTVFSWSRVDFFCVWAYYI